MVNSDVAFEIKEAKHELAAVKNELRLLSSKINPVDELWDDQDMVQNWKLSKRLLAEWRKNGVIDYVQYRNKIWYPREAREEFIAKHLVKSREEVDDESN